MTTKNRLSLLAAIILMGGFLLLTATALAMPSTQISPSNALSADAQNVELVGHIGVPALGEEVSVYGDHVLETSFDGLYSVDVSTPAFPILAGVAISDSADFHDSQVISPYAYITDKLGFQIWNISDPSHMTRVGAYLSGITHYGNGGIAVSDTYAYASFNQSPVPVLRVIDVANPTMPIETGSVATPGGGFVNRITNVVVSGTYAYLSGSDTLIADVSNPFSPTWVSSLPIWSYDITVKGHYAYVMGDLDPIYFTDNTRLHILDVSNPAQPVEMSNLVLPATGWNFAIAVEGHLAYVLAGDQTVWVVDVSDPAQPVQVGYYALPQAPAKTGAVGIAVSDGNIYVTDGGLSILRISDGAVTGQVTDGNGSPVWGANLLANSTLSATTDMSGRYTINGLRPNIYLLEPELAGYVFLPPTRTVNVPSANIVNHDFVMLPEPRSITLTPGVASTLTYTDAHFLPTDFAFSNTVVTQTTTILFTPTLASGSVGMAFAGHAFDLQAYQAGVLNSGFSFAAPVTVTINYSASDVRVVTDEAALTLRWWSGLAWEDVIDTCLPGLTYTRDISNNVVSVPICRSGRYALFGPTNQIFLPLVFVR